MAALFEHKVRPSIYLGWQRAGEKVSATPSDMISRLIGLYLNDILRPIAECKQRMSGGGLTEQQSILHGTQQYEDGLLGIAHEETNGIAELPRHGSDVPETRRLSGRRWLFGHSRQLTSFVMTSN